MAKPSTRQELIDYCLRQLGEPVLEVNVDEDQIDDLVDEVNQQVEQGVQEIVLTGVHVGGRNRDCSHSVTGDLALAGLSRGGVWLAGGTAGKLLQQLRSPRFVEAFLAKGRLRAALEPMPIRAVIDPSIGRGGGHMHHHGQHRSGL